MIKPANRRERTVIGKRPYDAFVILLVINRRLNIQQPAEARGWECSYSMMMESANMLMDPHRDYRIQKSEPSVRTYLTWPRREAGLLSA